MRLSRRELIHTGVAGMAVLALANCARSKAPARPPFSDPGFTYKILTGAEQEMMAAIGAAMLAGALPNEPDAIVKVVRGVEFALDALTPSQLGELQQLFGLLEFPLTRGFAAGIWSDWRDASTGDIAKFLEGWRFSGVLLFRTGYQALHTILMSAWYGNSASWARVGYPGPPVVN